MGNTEQAIADYDRALALDPDDARAYYNRGRVYSDLGDTVCFTEIEVGVWVLSRRMTCCVATLSPGT